MHEVRIQGCRDTVKIKGIIDRDSMVSTYIVDPSSATLGTIPYWKFLVTGGPVARNSGK